jgi:hypothetical protein
VDQGIDQLLTHRGVRLRVHAHAAACREQSWSDDRFQRLIRCQYAKSSHSHCFEWCVDLPSRQAVPGGGDLWGGEERSVGVGARTRALRELTHRVCLNATSAASEVSYAMRPQREHRSGVDAKHRPPQREPVPGAACRAARHCITIDRTRPGGEIGRHSGLKIRRLSQEGVPVRFRPWAPEPLSPVAMLSR